MSNSAIHDQRNNVSGFSGKSRAGVSDRSLGAILVDVGRLSIPAAESVARFQCERKIRFGEAAIEMGLLTHADIDFALSRQFAYPYLLRGESPVSEELVAGYAPFTRQVESLRALRSQLMTRWFDGGEARRAMAIASAQNAEGRSYLAANLAAVFSQQGQRTLLVDADMRNPRQHLLFGLENRVGLSAILSGRIGVEAIQRVPALLDLSILTAGAMPPNPLELLGRPAFEQVLRELAGRYDVILLDTPAGGQSADAQMIATRAGAALLVTRRNLSQVGAARNFTHRLAQARVCLVGTVLNEF